MKRFVLWTVLAAALMNGCPWLAVSFAGSAGMAICFLLFFAANPLFCILCGSFAGADIKRLWPLPIIAAALFLVGVWIFFEINEPAFLLYSGIYLAIGGIAMLISALLKGKKQ